MALVVELLDESSRISASIPTIMAPNIDISMPASDAVA